MTSLCVAERDHRDEAAGLGGVVVRDRGLEMLTLWCWLTKLPAQPTQQAHTRLVGHASRLALEGTARVGSGRG